MNEFVDLERAYLEAYNILESASQRAEYDSYPANNPWALETLAMARAHIKTEIIFLCREYFAEENTELVTS